MINDYVYNIFYTIFNKKKKLLIYLINNWRIKKKIEGKKWSYLYTFSKFEIQKKNNNNK